MASTAFPPPARLPRIVGPGCGGRSRSTTAARVQLDGHRHGGGTTPFGIVVAALARKMLKVDRSTLRRHLTLVPPGRTHLPSHHRDHRRGRRCRRPFRAPHHRRPAGVRHDRHRGRRGPAAKVFEIYGTLPSYRAMLDREGAAGPADVASPEPSPRSSTISASSPTSA